VGRGSGAAGEEGGAEMLAASGEEGGAAMRAAAGKKAGRELGPCSLPTGNRFWGGGSSGWDR
jgi:hypothetical protein